MTESRFETLFAAALAERGPAYLTARQAVLGLGPAALPELKARRTSTDWRVALQANILTGWLTSASLFRRCVDFVDGKLPGDPGITGTFGPKKRAAAVAELGPTVTPCLLELVMKVRGIDAEQKAAAFTSLQAMRDRSAATPLISLLADDDPDIRRSAAGVLGSFDDPSAVPPLLTLLEDARQPPAVRVSAAGSLGALGASQAAPILRDIVGNERLDLNLRGAAARTLAQLKDSQSTGVLVSAASGATDLTFLQILIETLGAIGDDSALPFLHAMSKHHDEFIREAAGDAEQQLGAR